MSITKKKEELNPPFKPKVYYKPLEKVFRNIFKEALTKEALLIS